MLIRLVEQLSIKTLGPEGHTALARFEDIVIQDGSSFAVKDALREVFSGRFTTVEPAAVEVHATYSGFSDEVSAVSIASDSEAVSIASDSEEERQFLPKPATLGRRLLLADRGYPSIEYLDEVREHGGSFIMRLSRSHNPWVCAAWLDGKRVPLRKPVRLSQFIAQHTGRRMDLDVEYQRGKRVLAFRVGVLPGNEQPMTRLCTNLPRTPFSLDLVSRLYRFRWQVELLFKEWKSYANLHKFNTANEHITAGLIWASLCAAVLKRFLAHAAQLIGGKPISFGGGIRVIQSRQGRDPPTVTRQPGSGGGILIQRCSATRTSTSQWLHKPGACYLPGATGSREAARAQDSGRR
jgi:hypothetical protein